MWHSWLHLEPSPGRPRCWWAQLEGAVRSELPLAHLFPRPPDSRMNSGTESVLLVRGLAKSLAAAGDGPKALAPESRSRLSTSPRPPLPVTASLCGDPSHQRGPQAATKSGAKRPLFVTASEGLKSRVPET